MPKASRETASGSVGAAGFESRSEDFEGGYTVGFETFTEDVDMTPLLAGLPDDLCPSPHWGYVFGGRLTYTFGDREEAIGEGEAFYVPAGHSLRADAGTDVVFFSPTADWKHTVETVAKNREGAGLARA